MAMNYWLVKQEPEAYAWDQFVADGVTNWSGVRNYQARNNLRAMKKGDQVLYYHSVTGKCVMGIAEVVKEHYPDTTAEKGDWSAVDISPVKPLKHPVSLAQIKEDPELSEVALVRHSRLSVMPLTAAEFKRIVNLGN
jgi:predicted RNA-binding protein with PUA-like domain